MSSPAATPGQGTPQPPPASAASARLPWLDPFVWRLAWRDSRSSRRRLLFFALALLIGVAAIAGVTAFGENLQRTVDRQARTLLGADLVVTGRRPFTREQQLFFESFGGEICRGANLSAMLVFPGRGEGRLVQLRAVEDGFPYYGELVTEPASAATTFRQAGVLVEESLLAQYGVRPGDPVRLGNLTTHIAGALRKVPGETLAFGAFAPRVYLSARELFATGLVRPDSLVRFKAYFRFAEGFNVEELVEQVGSELQSMRLSLDTVAERQEDLGKSMANLHHFLNLAGFIALLLGGIAVGSALHLHLRQKLATVATLRCLGASAGQAMTIYLLQALAVGAVSAVGGGLLGVALQGVLPRVAAAFLPFEVDFTFSAGVLVRSVLVGLLFCTLFALLPLLPVRRVAPLAALRRSAEEEPAGLDGAQLLVLLGLAGAVVWFALTQSSRWQVGLGLAAGLAVALALLTALAQGLRRAARRLGAAGLPYVWRQGLANLHRPNNRTLVLLLALGLGTFLLLTLQLTRHTLLHGLLPPAAGTRPNAVLFDIQPDQRDGVAAVLQAQQLPRLQEAPVVSMRLQSVQGVPVEQLLTNRASVVPPWILRREYRSTYRGVLTDSERLLHGAWPPPAFDPAGPVPVALEEDIARQLQVGLGDELVFDVQGLAVPTRVTALREVDWRRMEPNFFVVFPPGVIEEAPKFYILTTHVPTPEASARLQREVLQRFGNVSMIDVTLVLKTLDDILGQVSQVIQFMALFTVATGLVVLVGTLLAARYQRMQESILLRTLGASRRQVGQIQLAEYLSLGLLGALAGSLLAVAATGVLAATVLKVRFVLDVTTLAGTLLGVPLLTVGVGALTNRGLTRQPPLAVLRAES